MALRGQPCHTAHRYTDSHAHPCNVASSGSDAAHGNTNTTSRFGDEGTLLQCVIDTLDTVVPHGKQEAARESKIDRSYLSILG